MTPTSPPTVDNRRPGLAIPLRVLSLIAQTGQLVVSPQLQQDLFQISGLGDNPNPPDTFRCAGVLCRVDTDLPPSQCRFEPHPSQE